ncbi:hypothetical protein JG688_00011124 [Phytophthora aleatoria]|uniref:Uncharacterized protein n=1 Tax=Phytophthora aleatoria TaxID=2496075 RepID=A0A8J5M2X3_9STRA|nr:hypothetical protein JG688_00011124 [Phytophthora aleatoria]
MRPKGAFFAQVGRNAKWLGLSLKLSANAFDKRVSPLLETYASVRNRDIPGNFVIPSQDPWPERMWRDHFRFDFDFATRIISVKCHLIMNHI